jgi:hypothetical protein
VEPALCRQATLLTDLGARFGLSGEGMRQMELKALKAMRGMAVLEAGWVAAWRCCLKERGRLVRRPLFLRQ